jgi:hypothetical protein
MDYRLAATASLLGSPPPDKRPALPSAHPSKLPREGFKGGGKIIATNPVLQEVVVSEMQSFAEFAKPPAGLSRSHSRGREGGRRPSTVSGGISSQYSHRGSRKNEQAGSTATPRGSSGTPRSANYMLQRKAGKMGQAERKRVEITSKWQKLEAVRERDHKATLESVERGHERRDERFNRLLREVTGQDNLAYKTALALRERDDHEDKRKRELHAEWDEKVYQPLAEQLHTCLHPGSRADDQKLRGSKSVGFQLPGEKTFIKVNVHGDPARKSVVDHARENTFHGAASSVLVGSRSAPDLLRQTHSGILPHASNAVQIAANANAQKSIIALAKSRPTFEPVEWGQARLQGTMFGHFSQVAEHGPCFKRAQKGGCNAHLHDVSDNVLAGGTRKSRALGPGDVGILRGDTAAQGESSNYKTHHGSSSSAPAQDHFTYEKGHHVTALEFPLGNRMFPEFH